MNSSFLIDTTFNWTTTLDWALNVSDPRPRRANCGHVLDPNLINVISYCYVLPVVCAIGILGNTANLITLSSGRLNAVSYMYLRGLGVADLLCMIFVLIFVSFEIISSSPVYRTALNSYGVAWYRAHLVLPLINWSVSAGILLIVALTLERYISIAWPILFREWNSPRRAVIIITAAYLVTFALYIPMCWQMEALPVCPSRNSSHYNVTSMDYKTMEWTLNDNKLLLKSRGYNAYKLTREVLLKIIPIVALTFLNLQIIVAFKKVRNRRRRLNTNNQNATEQRSLLFLLAGIVVLFFICNIPAAMNLIIINEDLKKKKSYVVFRAIANILEITNHALNFYNFCLCSSDYRQTFVQKFPCVKRMQEGAEDIKRRVSNSMAKVQNNTKGASISGGNGKFQTSTSFIVSSSLKTPINHDNRYGPLRRALSSDMLTRLDHCHTRDDHGRRFGHHYGVSRFPPSRKYLGVPNGANRSDSLQNIFANRFEIIREDSRRQSSGWLADGVLQVNDISLLASPCVWDGKFAVVNFGYAKGEDDTNDGQQSSLTYVTADQPPLAADECDMLEATPMSTPNAPMRIPEFEGDCDDDTLSYSSANDIYL